MYCYNKEMSECMLKVARAKKENKEKERKRYEEAPEERGGSGGGCAGQVKCGVGICGNKDVSPWKL